MQEQILPRHIGFIMDGNGRWAKKRMMPRSFGHKAGAKAFRELIGHCQKRNIEIITVYAFSTENWKRPPEEVQALMKLLGDYLDEAFSKQDENPDVCLRVLGDLSVLSPELRGKIQTLVETTKDKTGIIVNIAFNYGGRDEIVHGIKQIVQKVQEGTLLPEQITEEIVSQNLYTAGQPDPDLIIRPSGELRLSNFLIWQAAYSEFVFMDVLWPDFGEKELDAALQEYARRSRRFGGI